MQREREELVRHVFPRLRKLCETRAVVWSEVDLRWGISRERQAEGLVLPICIEEIRRSRPFFICILGERYGSRPRGLSSDLLAREAWLRGLEDRSVTELEVIFGALRDHPESTHAFFYFRDPGFIDTLPEEEQPLHRCADPEDADRLARLKELIRSSHRVREGFSSPEQLAEWVEADLRELIDELYPAESGDDDSLHGDYEHQAYAALHQEGYVPPPGLFTRLTSHARGSQPPLVVTGESGLGKSALLANWVTDYRSQYPDEVVVAHFASATPSSGQWENILRHLGAELARKFSLPPMAQASGEELRREFPALLATVASRGRAVLVIDALNQLDDEPGARDLTWLPRSFPPQIRLIVSTLPGRPLDAARARKWTITSLEPLTPPSIQALMHAYLRRFGKADGLSKPLEGEITDTPQCANPLFLRTLLEEIRIHGDAHSVEEVVRDYLQSADPVTLLGKVLARFERDYERSRPGLVAAAMTHLWAARRGLTEFELRDLLGEDGRPLPHAHWSPLAIVADHILFSRSGSLTFAHDYVREAVERRYLPTAADAASAHLRLADYFERAAPSAESNSTAAIRAATKGLRTARLAGKHEPIDRHTDEFPWQLLQAGDWTRLAEWLSRLPDCIFAYIKSRQDFLTYWAAVQNNSSLGALEGYRPVWEAPDKFPNALSLVTSVLENFGHSDRVAALLEHVVTHWSPDSGIEYEAALFRFVHILIARAEFERARQISRDAGTAFRAAGLRLQQGKALALEGATYREQRDLDHAERLLEEASAIFREVDDREELHSTLLSLAGIQTERGDREGALERLVGLEASHRAADDSLNLIAVLCIQGDVLTELHREADAEVCYLEAESLLTQLGEADLLASYLFNRGATDHARDRLQDARAWYEKAAALAREIGNESLSARCRFHIAQTLVAAEELPRALELLTSAEAFYRQSGEISLRVQVCLARAMLLMHSGALDDAETAMKEAEALARRTGSPEVLLKVVGNHALLLHALDRPGRDIAGLLVKALELIEGSHLHDYRERLTAIANLAASRLMSDTMACTLREEPEEAAACETALREFCGRWELEFGDAYVAGMDALRALQKQETEAALAALETAARVLGDKSGEDGRDELIRLLTFLASRLGAGSIDNLSGIPTQFTLLKRQEALLRTLGGRRELIRNFAAQCCLCLMVLHSQPVDLPRDQLLAALEAAQPGVAVPERFGFHSFRMTQISELVGLLDAATFESRLLRADEAVDEIPQLAALIVSELENQADQLVDAGKLEEARDVLEVSARVAARAESPTLLATTLAQCAMIRSAAGHPELAREMAVQAAELASAHGQHELLSSLGPLLSG